MYGSVDKFRVDGDDIIMTVWDPSENQRAEIKATRAELRQMAEAKSLLSPERMLEQEPDR